MVKFDTKYIIYIGIIVLVILLWNCANNNVENFVAWNNVAVRDTRPFGLLRDDEQMRKHFADIVEKDKNKFVGQSFDNLRTSEWFEEQVKGIIHYVLKRINLESGRHFTALDLQNAEKKAGFDPRTGEIVNRFTVNLFVQDIKPKEVHANAANISFTVLQMNDTVKIEKLHTITDHFYKKPLIDGDNVHDRYYKIENPFHLMRPWKTSGDNIMFSDKDTLDMLDQWHNDLKTPQYRCFTEDGVEKPIESSDFYTEHGNRFKAEKDCEANQGTWDKPVAEHAECPFYRANKHYPNRLGGIKLHTDQCEMPINTKTIGYRYISNDPKHKPWCYNCHVGADGMAGSYGPCCEEQMDPDLYPQLGGNPDYAFPGDEFERAKFWRELAERGLNWRKHPTKIRDITNQNQKAPVFNKIIGPGPGMINLP